jgi:fatty acid desaturase
MEEINREGERKNIRWYRCKIDRDQMRKLQKRSDLMGWLQTGGHFGLLVLTAGLAMYGAFHWPWYIVLGLVFLHGTFGAFLLNGFHELCHMSVFRSRALNRFWLRVYSFFGWHNYHMFIATHTKHHQYTLHPPQDLEVVLPQHLTVKQYVTGNFVNPRALPRTVRDYIAQARGELKGEWVQNVLFPESEPDKRKALADWARTTVVGHGLLVLLAVGLAIGTQAPQWLLLPVLTSCLPAYGQWLMILCNLTQHIGLKDNVPDFRLCCRTVRLNPFLQFLYWHMNYHIEHHMFAAVPCYNLGKLHRTVRHELPGCPRGLVQAWRQIAAIQAKQKNDPEYQFQQDVPAAG